jgi:uncharacterized protein (TIGR03086 family)
MSKNTVTQWAILNAAHDALRAAVVGVAPQDWERATPCERWTVTQVLQHAAGDQHGYAATITGSGFPSEDPFAPSGQLDEPPLMIAERAMQASADAWSTVGKDADVVPTPLPQGALPVGLAVGACALDAAVHAWDIAVATGQPSPLEPNLARELLPVATSIVEPLRGYGAYASELDPADGDDDVARLLKYLGRRPDWSV